jgi:anti-anti-sigma regulatory factor
VVARSGDHHRRRRIDTGSVRLLQRALWQDWLVCFVLDLSRVTFFGSAGLRALEGAVIRACAEHRRIGIVSAARSVLRPLRIFDIDTHVGIYPILAAALREVPLSPPPTVAIPGVGPPALSDSTSPEGRHMPNRVWVSPDAGPIPCERCGRDTLYVARVVSGEGTLLGRVMVCTSCRPDRRAHRLAGHRRDL